MPKIMEKTDPSIPPERDGKIYDVHLSLEVDPRLLPFFFQLLGDGFKVTVPLNCSVKELLCSHLDIQEDYLEDRIQTIILNGKAVDDVSTTAVEAGSTLALSGAMPGLVGAILRRGGAFAPMRQQISHNQTGSETKHDTGEITLKLFNLVVKELGPAFLQRGVWIKGRRLQEFILRYADELVQGCHALKLDGNSRKIDPLSQLDLSNQSVFLQIIAP